VVRFYGLTSAEVKATKVSEVLCCLENMNRIMAEESEMDFLVMNNAFSGNAEFLANLKTMRLPLKERRKAKKQRQEIQDRDVAGMFNRV